MPSGVSFNELSSSAQLVLASLLQASSLALEQLQPYLKHFVTSVLDINSTVTNDQTSNNSLSSLQSTPTSANLVTQENETPGVENESDV